MNDDQIHHLILAGNQEGLTLLLDKYGGLMTYIAANIGKFSDEDMAECISDTLLAIWKRIHNYKKDKSSFKSWVVLVTRGCTIDYLRKNRKHSEVVHLEDMGEYIVNEPYDSLDISIMIELLNRLTPPDNEIFYRHFILGEKITFISEALNITKENVYKRIARGRGKLRAALIEEGYYV